MLDLPARGVGKGGVGKREGAEKMKATKKREGSYDPSEDGRIRHTRGGEDVEDLLLGPEGKCLEN